MNRWIALVLTFSLSAVPGFALAADPTASPMSTAAPVAVPMPTASAQAPLTAAERAFIKRIQAKLPRLYPTPAAAEKAGYYRFNNEDATGAISWTNGNFNAPDPEHPTQLWYDVNGRLLGADFSAKTDDNPNGPPALFGVQPSRLIKENWHIHYGLKQPDGTIKYGIGMGAKAYADASGMDAHHPTAEGLVKAGRAKSIDEVAFVFSFEGNYDVQVWVLPNPAGQFAEANPNVRPSAARVKNSSEGH